MDTRFERGVATRKRLINSALALLTVKGFQQMTIDEISEKAGFSKGAFYFHFESKEAMFVAMVKYLEELGLLWPPYPEVSHELGLSSKEIESMIWEIWVEARWKPEIRKELANSKKPWGTDVDLALKLGSVVQHQVLALT